MLTGVDVGKVLGDLTGLLGNVGEAGADRREFREKGMALMAELETAWGNTEARMVEANAQIAIADAQGKGVFQRLWRPICATAVCAQGIMTVNGLLYALLKQIPIDAGVVNICLAWIGGTFALLGVYNIGRSFEKRTAMETIASVTTSPLRAERGEDRKELKNRAKMAAKLRKQGFSEDQITEVLTMAED